MSLTAKMDWSYVGAVAAALLISSLCACHSHEGRKTLSRNFVHRATEVVSKDEVVEVYLDVNNDNLCYFYYFNERKEATVLSCIKQRSSLDYP